MTELTSINKEIKRLTEIYNEMKKEIEEKIKNPSFSNLVVVSNVELKYFIRTVDDIQHFFKEYQIATSGLMVEEGELEEKTLDNRQPKYNRPSNVSKVEAGRKSRQVTRSLVLNKPPENKSDDLDDLEEKYV